MNAPAEKDLTPLDAPPVGAYSTSAARMQGLPGERPVYHPPTRRKMDRMVGTLMAILGVAAIFLLIIALLTSISPNAPTELVPKGTTPLTGSDSETAPQDNLGILGD